MLHFRPQNSESEFRSLNLKLKIQNLNFGYFCVSMCLMSQVVEHRKHTNCFFQHCTRCASGYEQFTALQVRRFEKKGHHMLRISSLSWLHFYKCFEYSNSRGYIHVKPCWLQLQAYQASPQPKWLHSKPSRLAPSQTGYNSKYLKLVLVNMYLSAIYFTFRRMANANAYTVTLVERILNLKEFYIHSHTKSEKKQYL